MVLEKTLENPLDCKEIQLVHPKGDQSWVFIGRTVLKLKLQYFGHLMRRADLWKDPDAGKDWGQEEKGTTEDEMVGWHHWLNGHVFGWTPGVGDGQGGLACCSSWGCKESDTTEQLNWEVNWVGIFTVMEHFRENSIPSPSPVFIWHVMRVTRNCLSVLDLGDPGAKKPTWRK